MDLRSMMFAALLALLLTSGRAGAARRPTVQFVGAGADLFHLPGASSLNPKGLVHKIDIRMVAATVQGPAGSKSPMLNFTGMIYESSKGAFLHGPTIRVRAGDKYSIRLTNDLPVPNPKNKPNISAGFETPTHTNLHSHGTHESPGLLAQTNPPKYTGGDNMFVDVPPGKELYWNSRLPKDHLPGLYWYHPHHHGSSTVQTFSANGLIIVEDDPKWLPNRNGCGPVKEALREADEVILHFELLTFAPPNAFNDSNTASWYQFIGPVNASLDDTNFQAASNWSDPMNPLCCDAAEGTAVHGSAASKDFVLVNGGWKPKLRMQAGQWQRWRAVHTGFKRFLDLQIVDPAGNPTPDCQLALLAKDGIYVPRMPRTVNHIFLTAGNRAELLVRCSKEGSYVLTAGRRPSPFGPGFGSLSWFEQKVVLSLDVAGTDKKPAKALKARACEPLYPSYAADLSDRSLRKQKATDKLDRQNVGFVFGNSVYGCYVGSKTAPDGANFTYPDPHPLSMPLGKVVEWNFTNLMEHPLHLHTNPFYIADLPKAFLLPNTTYTSWFEVGDRHDTLQLPMIGAVNQTNSIPLRIQPGEFTGYSVMHCHFLQHEDEGCMKVVRWHCPGHKDPQPRKCPGFSFPVQGTYGG